MFGADDSMRHHGFSQSCGMFIQQSDWSVVDLLAGFDPILCCEVKLSQMSDQIIPWVAAMI